MAGGVGRRLVMLMLLNKGGESGGCSRMDVELVVAEAVRSWEVTPSRSPQAAGNELLELAHSSRMT